ncbi:hypothetical protein [Egicoccus sp. AB-alg2]|uniref:hypothetical protein n=1 Tax=Egicoccus sp. AB-alg2 TaxID=3242693 RepID=UPI00359CC344
MRPPRRLLAMSVAAAVLLGCSGDEGGVDSVDLGEDAAPQTGDTSGEPADEEDPSDTAAGDDTADDDAADDPADDAAGDPDAGTGADEDEAAADLVDTTQAVPGTWPVGDAGTVTWDVRDGALVLVDVSPSEGWDATVDEEGDDEVEVDFRRGDEGWDFEVEVDDGRLEIDVYYDRRNADPGAYDLPDGGSFVFDASGDALTLTSIEAPPGWEVTEREEERDEFSFTLVAGDRRVEVEVELDDGRIEVEIDYRVAGPLPG